MYVVFEDGNEYVVALLKMTLKRKFMVRPLFMLSVCIWYIECMSLLLSQKMVCIEQPHPFSEKGPPERNNEVFFIFKVLRFDLELLKIY